MPNVKVKDKETLLDVAILNTGDFMGVFGMALQNNISITKDLASGDVLDVSPVINQSVVTELRSRNARPASALDETMPLNRGIGFWRIFVDFVVS